MRGSIRASHQHQSIPCGIFHARHSRSIASPATSISRSVRTDHSGTHVFSSPRGVSAAPHNSRPMRCPYWYCSMRTGYINWTTFVHWWHAPPGGLTFPRFAGCYMRRNSISPASPTTWMHCGCSHDACLAAAQIQLWHTGIFGSARC